MKTVFMNFTIPEHNPAFRGNYIAQSKSELKYFKAMLGEMISKRINIDEIIEKLLKWKKRYHEWPTFYFDGFKEFTESQLRSFNPLDCKEDLIEILELSNHCHELYNELLKYIDDSSTISTGSENEIISPTPHQKAEEYLLHEYTFINLVKDFCEVKFKRLNQLELRQKAEKALVDKRVNEYYHDIQIINGVLKNALLKVQPIQREILINYIMSYRYPELKPSIELPNIELTVKSQNSLKGLLSRLKDLLCLDEHSGQFLANIFSSCYMYKNGKPFFFSHETLRKGISSNK